MTWVYHYTTGDILAIRRDGLLPSANGMYVTDNGKGGVNQIPEQLLVWFTTNPNWEPLTGRRYGTPRNSQAMGIILSREQNAKMGAIHRISVEESRVRPYKELKEAELISYDHQAFYADVCAYIKKRVPLPANHCATPADWSASLQRVSIDDRCIVEKYNPNSKLWEVA